MKKTKTLEWSVDVKAVEKMTEEMDELGWVAVPGENFVKEIKVTLDDKTT